MHNARRCFLGAPCAINAVSALRMAAMTSSTSRATPADAADIAALGRLTFAEAFGRLYTPSDLEAFSNEKYQPQIFSAYIEDPAQAVFKATVNGVIVGYAHAGPCNLPHADVTPSCGELKRLYVRRSAQGLGLGTLLLDAALAWLEKPGRVLWIGVWSQNVGAQKLYAGRGFTLAGEYKFLVGSAQDDELILRRG